MRTTKRERYIALATLIVVGIMALDRTLLTPYFNRRTQLAAEKRGLLDEMERARGLISRRKELAPQWEAMLKAGLKSDAAAAEGAVLNAVRDWAEESGLTLSSLKPERSTQRGQLREITFQAVCTGTMSGMSRFLWRIEAAVLPVKVNDMQLATRKEGSDDLTLQVRIAALCIAPASAVPAQPAAPSVPGTEETKQ